MIAEFRRFLRHVTRPLGRSFWWPGKSSETSDAPGVVLVSLCDADETTYRRLLKRFRHYQRHPLLDSSRPQDRGLEKPDSGLTVTYRVLVFLARSATFWRELSKGNLSWAVHLCECDGLARAHRAVMLGLPYHHLGDLRGRRWRELRHLERLIRTLDHRRYEIWLVFRNRKEAYVPESLALPEVPLSVKELEQLARTRSHPVPTVTGFSRLPPEPGVLRLMSYNVHSCIGLDGRLSVRRIAEVLERYSPHFVALQELDSVCRRTGYRDQLRELSGMWPSEGFFFPAMAKAKGEYGIGCLSRLPIRAWRGHRLPRARSTSAGTEPRVAIEAELEWRAGEVITIINTHLGLTRSDRMAQLEGLEKLIDQAQDGVILLGDLNCPPRSAEIARLLKRLRHVTPSTPKTWFGAFPVRVLDYAMQRGAGKVVKSFVPIDGLTVTASDHLPLIVDLVPSPTNQLKPKDA